MDYLKYKGYKGSVEYSETDKCLFGKVLGLSDTLILYEGCTLAELKVDFEDSVDNYINSCIEDGIRPEMPHTSLSVTYTAIPVAIG